MSISEERTKTVDPIGLYVVASTPVLFKDDYKHNEIAIRTTTRFLSGLFAKKGYLIKPLNTKVKKAEVFEKYSFYFDIDKKKVAKVGKIAGCSSVLIVYLAYTGNAQRLESGLKAYRDCSVHAWLVDTEKGKTISSCRTPPRSFDEFLEAGLARRKERPKFEHYRSFLIGIASEIFSRFPVRSGKK